MKSELERRKRTAKTTLGCRLFNSSSSVKALHTVMAVMELGASVALLC
jgi:cytochrome bd-type quinol oxidase subunit 1